MKKYLELLQITFKEWNEDNVPRLAASLSYYTAFSLAPLIILFISILGFFFGDEAARGQIVAQFSDELGLEIADFIQEMIQGSSQEAQGIFSTIISVIMLIAGATGVFMQLQTALNEVWDIEVEGGFTEMIKKRLLSFGMIMSLAFLLLISLIINGVLASLDSFFIGIVPGAQFIGQLITVLISFGVSTLLFAIIYKYMPDAKIAWRDVIVGAIVTSLLFSLGRFGLGLYLGNFGVTSTFGAAGSFVVILLWVYYSAQIVMFGAEFTQVYARRYGTQIVPDEGAHFSVSRQLAMQDIEVEDIQAQILEAENVMTEKEAMIGKLDPPIEIKDKDIIQRPAYALIASSFVAVLGVSGAAIGWMMGKSKKS